MSSFGLLVSLGALGFCYALVRALGGRKTFGLSARGAAVAALVATSIALAFRYEWIFSSASPLVIMAALCLLLALCVFLLIVVSNRFDLVRTQYMLVLAYIAFVLLIAHICISALSFVAL